jgi:hypothetical protein
MKDVQLITFDGRDPAMRIQKTHSLFSGTVSVESSQKRFVYAQHTLFSGPMLTGPLALMKMRDGDNLDQANFKATYALLFFGVPNRGMETRGFTPIVHDAPNRYLVEVLRTGSDFLREQSGNFPKLFHFTDSEIISYYETEETATAQKLSPSHFSSQRNPIVNSSTGWGQMEKNRRNRLTGSL